MIESQALYVRQKAEIDSLFARLGKAPPGMINPPVLNPAGRRRRPTKSKSSKSSRSSLQSSKSPVQPGIPSLRPATCLALWDHSVKEVPCQPCHLSEYELCFTTSQKKAPVLQNDSVCACIFRPGSDQRFSVCVLFQQPALYRRRALPLCTRPSRRFWPLGG